MHRMSSLICPSIYILFRWQIEASINIPSEIEIFWRPIAELKSPLVLIISCLFFITLCINGLALEQGGVASTVVDKLQTVERRLSGTTDEALACLRGALPSSTPSDYLLV